MTYPCLNEDQIEVDPDGGITPKIWLQWRHVATQEVVSEVRLITVDTPTPGTLVNDIILSWVNPSPINQWVFGEVTRGGDIVVATGTRVIACEQRDGVVQGAGTPADPAVTAVSRHAVGPNTGVGPPPDFSIMEDRQPRRRRPIGNVINLPPGHMYKIRTQIRVMSDQWSVNPTVSAEAENAIVTGSTRLDLYAYPVL